MLSKIASVFVPSKNVRLLKSFGPIVARINDLESVCQALADEELPLKSDELRRRHGEGESLDDLLPEAFALIRETSRRALGERHFDAQLLGGIALHTGRIAEMKTGEGKTLASTAPAYLNALTGRGVHIVTPNDYLAKRDSQWMGQIYERLGFTVGLIQHGMDDPQRREAYGADITYGTNNEYGFDYLRDNMKFTLEEYVQRPFYFAIVDEVDSILIDEARTPLIISGPTDETTEKYYTIHKVMFGLEREIRKEEVANLPPTEHHGIREDWETLEERAMVREGDYSLDEKSRSITLTDKGSRVIEERLRKIHMLGESNLFDFDNIEILHHVNQALKANYMFKNDVDYVVNESKVVIVDEFTGRLMPGRRFSDGLHQALEAKENVTIERESQTYASITFQNYFRMYEKLAGMTGTAKTEEEEFIKIYGMEVAVIPTNRPMIRDDQPDVIYKTKEAKSRAVVRDIQEIHATGQPVLVGTISIEASEALSRQLKKVHVPHTVLNAKYHEQEAEIIANAGEAGRVTIATNMAGRGTDIKLGEGVTERGGLFIVGTERHESRRIDNQLRGRSGRQGDPGGSRFYLSLEDDLMRIFGGERIAGLMTRLKVEEDEAITHSLISRAIETAQKKVEAHNFEIRKHVLEYDDVMNRQREIIYGQRREILGGDIENILLDMTDEVVEDIITEFAESKHLDQWDVEGLRHQYLSTFGTQLEVDWDDQDISSQTLRENGMAQAEVLYSGKREALRGLVAEAQGRVPSQEEANEVFHGFQRQVLLSITDNMWKDHLLSMDHLREGIGLVGYAQKKPIDEYKREGFNMFSGLMFRISKEAVTTFNRAQFGSEQPAPVTRREVELDYTHEEGSGEFGQAAASDEAPAAPALQPVRKGEKLGRNAPCHCGSGKKYKNCHMRLEQQAGLRAG
ncbi:MAG: preprotein translocase subunit SecA [SAR324 cluster bacterium]|nr:preprotein translocase subunit SecA [SAR324 cluster bacterium]